MRQKAPDDCAWKYEKCYDSIKYQAFHEEIVDEILVVLQVRIKRKTKQSKIFCAYFAWRRRHKGILLLLLVLLIIFIFISQMLYTNTRTWSRFDLPNSKVFTTAREKLETTETPEITPEQSTKQRNRKTSRIYYKLMHYCIIFCI